MIEKWNYFAPLILLMIVIMGYIIADRIKELLLFSVDSYYRRTCKSCGVSQILDEDEGFMIWKKTANSNCKCSRYISYFIK